ncbi:ABC transporter substrate-binding protein [Arthrobacter castelli]|uniref:ABC transporter substrate-binding protein n=1 Tax=Arthrobacter castelli TaxID=271431 RepID=UPI000425D4DC|nr:sugar ABC transporter substrate-binding protein [Arthrobacter castelli]
MRRNLLRTVLAASSVLAISLTGCSSGSSGSDDTTLVFRQFDPAAQIQGLEKAVDAWNNSHPDIQVELQTLSPNDVQQFAREANSGTGPDITQLGLADVAFVADPDILLPLDKYLKSDPSIDADNLLAMDMVKSDGKTWAMPWTVDTMALVYNPKALASAGIDAPPTSWEELADNAAKISSSSGGEVAGFCWPAGGAATSSGWYAINYYIWSHGGTLIEKSSSGKWQPGVSRSQLEDAIKYLNGLFVSGATPTSYQAVSDYSDAAILNELATGDCAMSYQPPATFRTVQSQADAQGIELVTAPMPDGTTDGSTHLGGRALGINRNTEHPDAAWEFIKYLMSSDTFESYDQYPASTSTLSKLDVPEAEKGYVKQLPHAESFARYIGSETNVGTIQEIVNGQFSAVYSGQKDAQSAASAILKQLRAALKG